MAGTYSYLNLPEEVVSQVTASPSVELGSRQLYKGTEYVYVYNTTGTAAVGRGVIASANSGFSVSVGSEQGDKCFGVVANTDLDASSYGWVAVRGYATIYNDSTGIDGLIGDSTGETLFYLGADGGFSPVTTGTTGKVMLNGKVVAQGIENITSSATGKAYIKCLG